MKEIIALTCGHGDVIKNGYRKNDPGACVNGIKEAEFVKAFYKAIKDEYLTNPNNYKFEIVFVEELTKDQKTARARQLGALALVELHADSTHKSVRGTNVLFDDIDNNGDPTFADTLRGVTSKALNTKRRKNDPNVGTGGRDLALIRRGNFLQHGSYILETLCLSNRDDAKIAQKIIHDRNFAQQCARLFLGGLQSKA